jgi:SAM-dependent methyltransferase
MISGEMYSPYVLKCLKKLDIKKGFTVIDIACGTGRHAHLMAINGCDVVALDIDKDILIKCQLTSSSLKMAGIINSKVHMVQANATKVLPFKSTTFDLAIVIHFPRAFQFNEIGRVLGEGGYLIYETIGRQGENWRDLPQLGSVRNAVLEQGASVLDYREHPAGPSEYGCGSVKMLAQF